jgi:competence protein ComEA
VIVVPEMGSGEAFTGPPADGRVRINNATLEEITTLPGIGPVLAQRIFDHRETNGPFGTVEDLLDVSGIGEGKLANIRESITIP